MTDADVVLCDDRYHSHFSTQYCDGLRGALIIRDEKDREVYHYDVDNGT